MAFSKTKVLITVIIFVSLFTFACSKVTQENYEKIKFGMVYEEVIDFERGIAAYQQQNFTDAEKIFQDLHANNPRQLYSLYLERIEAYTDAPPPADWDGVFIFTTK